MPTFRWGSVCACAMLALAAATTGCTQNYGPRAAAGIVYYCPGAGNYDGGDQGLRAGLEAAGYEGEVAPFYWSIAPIGPLGGVIDQLARLNPRLRARALAHWIEEYTERYPGRPVNLVGLSAGTGVALWALEHLREGVEVDNVVLLSSSLSSTFDVSRAARRVRGRIYCYHSPNDAILSVPMRLTGTIDGVFTARAAGLVGLHSPRGADCVVNVAWRPEFDPLGYHGGHTDATSPAFVRAEIAPHIIRHPVVASATPDRGPAMRLDSGPRDEPEE